MAKKPVRVHIFNQVYTVLTDGDESQVQAIARELDELMTMIAARAGSGDSARVAVLASLHMADKLRTAETRLAEAKEAQQSTQGKSGLDAGRLARMLDEIL